MFGLKILTKKEYNQMLSNRDIIAVEKQALGKMLDEVLAFNQKQVQDSGCQVGPWCAKCVHGKEIRATVNCRNKFCWVDTYNESRGYYCTKHINDICPDFKRR